MTAPAPSQRSRPCWIANGQRSPYSVLRISILSRGCPGSRAITERKPNIRPTTDARLMGLRINRMVLIFSLNSFAKGLPPFVVARLCWHGADESSRSLGQMNSHWLGVERNVQQFTVIREDGAQSL